MDRNRELWGWISQNLNPLTLILLMAAWFRFGHLFDLPLTYDEHSSLMRIGADSYAQMLELGVWGDGHPAGLYTFLRAYVQLFGDDPWVLKLPFLLMGMLTVVFSYKVGKAWFSQSAGWLTAAIVGLFVFSLEHSLSSRMYTPGLLFCLLATLAWSRLAFKDKGNKWIEACLMGLCFALAVYTHYFAGLFCVLLWLGGWIFIKKSRRVPYLLSAAFGSLLFLPHLGITMHQLSVGGIPTVLSVPKLSFFTNHFALLANFSWVLGVPMLFFGGVALVFRVWKDKKVAFALFLWLGPMLVGWIYSSVYSPLLQDRVLLFSLPFMGIFLGASLPKPTGNQRVGYFLSILILTGLYLIESGTERYKLLYKGEFTGVLDDALEHNENQQAKHLLCIKNEILEYYNKKMALEDLQIVNPDSLWKLCDYESVIKKHYPNPLSFAWTTQYFKPPNEVQGMLRSYYGKPTARVNYPSGEYFFYGGRGDCIDPYREISVLGADQYWNNDMHVNGGHWFYSPDQVWGLTFEERLLNIANHRNDRIFFSVEGNWSEYSHSKVVVELLEDEETVFWKSVDLGNFGRGDSVKTAHICLPLYNVDEALCELNFKAYIWNEGKEKIEVKGARIWSDGGNYLLYNINRPLIEVDKHTHFAKQ